MTRTIRTRLALFGIASAILFAAAPRAIAQTMTPEGTTITNTATVSFTDANGNSYANQSASVTVTVGFKAGIDVTSTATVTPSSPSTGNTASFPVNNTGNGTDTVSVNVPAVTGLSITGYRIGTTTYATLADLNTALATTGVASGSSVTVVVVYDVLAGQGGATLTLSLTATSKRDTAVNDVASTSVQPAVAAAVSVTPDNSSIDRVPNSATVTTYTETFTVTNNGNASDTYTLAASTSNTAMITGITIVGGTSVTIASGASSTISVTYSIPSTTANGSTGTLVLAATSNTTGSITDNGSYNIRAAKAVLAIAKVAYMDDGSTVIDNGAGDKVLPGQYIRYRVTVTNNGFAPASAVSVTDALPHTYTTWQSNTGDSSTPTAWTFTNTTVSGTVTQVKADLAGSLDAGASRFFWVRVLVK